MIAIMYDVTNEESFQNCKKWMNYVTETIKFEHAIPGVCIANKIDLTQRRTVSPKAGQEFAKAHKLQYFECSAVSIVHDIMLLLTVKMRDVQ